MDGCTADDGLNQEDTGCQLEARGVIRLPGTLRITGIERLWLEGLQGGAMDEVEGGAYRTDSS